MDWLGFFMLGMLVGFACALSISNSIDKDIDREKIFEHKGRYYRLVKINPQEVGDGK